MTRHETEGIKIVCQNKKARHNYTIEDTFEAGLVLRGTEVKSLRNGKANLVDSYATINGEEAWLNHFTSLVPNWFGTKLFWYRTSLVPK